jgi:hypothetical protein
MKPEQNRYSQIIESIFAKHYRKSITEFAFNRAEIIEFAKVLGIELPKNLGDIIYSFRYRTPFPTSITDKAPEGFQWIIRPAGRSIYKFALVPEVVITPSKLLAETKIPDGTPGVIIQYTLNDEQALLAQLRYNRLIDIFTGLTCYSLQNHLRTTAPGLGQVETDEVYVGLDRRGVHYVITIQAKSGKEKLGIVQIEQDFAICAAKFPSLIPRPIAAQFIEHNLIALFEFEQTKEGVRVSAEKHYRLVEPEELSEEELQKYRRRTL